MSRSSRRRAASWASTTRCRDARSSRPGTDSSASRSSSSARSRTPQDEPGLARQPREEPLLHRRERHPVALLDDQDAQQLVRRAAPAERRPGPSSTRVGAVRDLGRGAARWRRGSAGRRPRATPAPTRRRCRWRGPGPSGPAPPRRRGSRPASRRTAAARRTARAGRGGPPAPPRTPAGSARDRTPGRPPRSRGPTAPGGATVRPTSAPPPSTMTTYISTTNSTSPPSTRSDPSTSGRIVGAAGRARSPLQCARLRSPGEGASRTPGVVASRTIGRRQHAGSAPHPAPSPMGATRPAVCWSYAARHGAATTSGEHHMSVITSTPPHRDHRGRPRRRGQQALRPRGRCGRRARRRQRRRSAGRVHRDHGAVRLRQVDPAPHARRPRPAHVRKVFLGDTEITTLNDRALTLLRRDRIGFIFQSFNLLPTMTAAENIVLPMRIAGRKPDEHWVASIVETVGLSGRLDHRPAELSGGQQQRVAAARALASRPEIVFADEPTGALDSQSGAELLAFLRTAVDELGQTVVMVTHDATAASYADRVIFLADGHIVDEMHAADGRRHPRLHEAPGSLTMLTATIKGCSRTSCASPSPPRRSHSAWPSWPARSSSPTPWGSPSSQLFGKVVGRHRRGRPHRGAVLRQPRASAPAGSDRRVRPRRRSRRSTACARPRARSGATRC